MLRAPSYLHHLDPLPKDFGKAMAIAAAEAPSPEEVARRAAFGESARTRAARKRQALVA